MSQILTVQLDIPLQDLCAALQRRGISISRAAPGRKQLLPVSAECVPEPVDLVCPAGSANTLEAWGFRIEGSSLTLVCGEFDKDILVRELLEPVRQELAKARIDQALRELKPELEASEQPDAIITVHVGDCDDHA